MSNVLIAYIVASLNSCVLWLFMVPNAWINVVSCKFCCVIIAWHCGYGIYGIDILDILSKVLTFKYLDFTVVHFL